MSNRSNYNYGNDWSPKDMQENNQLQVFGVRVGFQIAFLISVAIHLLVLGAVFIEKQLIEEPEFKPLKVRLQENGDDKQYVSDLLSQANQEALLVPKINQPSKEITPDDSENYLSAKEKEAASLAAKNIEDDKKKAEESKKNAQTEVKPVSKPSPTTNYTKKKSVGNSKDANAEGLMRYEQLLPLWLERFRTYPPMAKQLGLEGNGVVYLRIDRKGKVLFASVSRSTGHQILDDALLSMVAAANPVIAVPVNYNPKLNELSYQIEFRFKLDEEYQIPVYQ